MHVAVSKHSDVQRLVRVFGEYPSLAHLVVELDISSATLFDPRIAPRWSTFVGWGELVLRQPQFTSLRTLRLCHLDFRVYPPSYYKCFTSFHSVTHLEISWVTFQTIRDLLRLVWAFRALEYLQLSSGLQIQDQRTTRYKLALEEFCAARYPFLCPKLRFLDILCTFDTEHDYLSCIPVGAYGVFVRKMHLGSGAVQFHQWTTSPDDLGRLLNAIPTLEDLTLSFHAGFDTLSHSRDERYETPLLEVISMHAPRLTRLSFKVTIRVLDWSEDTASTREPLMTMLHAMLFESPRNWRAQKAARYRDRTLPLLEDLSLAVVAVSPVQEARCVLSGSYVPTLMDMMSAEWTYSAPIDTFAFDHCTAGARKKAPRLHLFGSTVAIAF
ncbi:uncharacterized protein TRAVEDRAFT_46288 [Trametes versicolor FP-101664 SS1]|uniref:uncharacterized protein n=1 Tax=Trametes versicolor (strain FP-101664) TaxID=717944 RepID=UPI0004624627|nr:uncharacterized protein TRAVEDRAFT_46288 [Trametes versicolor FP-101664 SS1]EIW61064.1 hypothetical protein TRAVEDRAFT_46288 [Trametes versicolor FP-101664 SS1]